MKTDFAAWVQNWLPIIQAPMAGGITTPELAAAVSNSNAIGGFGFAYSDAEKIHSDLHRVRKLTDKPINANFFIFPEQILPSDDECGKAINALENLPLEFAHEYKTPSEPFFPVLEQQLQPIWEHKPELLTFHFGLPPLEVIEKAHSLGMFVGITATNLDEARSIEKSGADFMVAQGIQAGGHRGTFDPNGTGDEKLPTTRLLEILKKSCSLPIVAAGGIMDGHDIRGILEKGAIAVQMGTAFLCCQEAGTHAMHRKFILTEHGRKTSLTKAFSGRWARGIDNEFISLMEDKFVLPFPMQNTLTNSLRKFASKTSNAEYQSLWAGSEFKKVRSMNAGRLIRLLECEMQTQPSMKPGLG